MSTGPPSGIALALAQVGARSTQRLAAALAVEGLSPPHLGVLRFVGQHPGSSQQELAAALGIAPSRVVALVDELEDKHLVERHRSGKDRRTYELSTPASAGPQLTRIRKIVRDHDTALIAPLTDPERTLLSGLLAKLASPEAG